MLKYCGAALLALASLSVGAQELTSYDQVVDAISHQGQGIRAVWNVKNCQSDYPIDIDAVGSMIPDSVMAIEGKYVTFASLHFTTHEPQYVGRGVYESSKFKLLPDNTLDMTTEVLDAMSFQKLGSVSHTTCTLGEGAKFYSVN